MALAAASSAMPTMTSITRLLALHNRDRCHGSGKHALRGMLCAAQHQQMARVWCQRGRSCWTKLPEAREQGALLAVNAPVAPHDVGRQILPRYIVLIRRIHRHLCGQF